MTTTFISVAGAAAAATSCWEHLPSHSPLPLRRSARAFGGCECSGSGHSLLECAVFECRELMPELVESTPGRVRTAACPPQLLLGASAQPQYVSSSAFRTRAFDERSGHLLLEFECRELRT